MRTIRSLAEADLVLEQFWPRNMARYAYTTEHVERFMEYLGNPQDKPRSVHIAGTSGKTSTAYYTAALLQQAGKKVGLLTSPHIESLNERVQVNLTPLPEVEFCSELTIFMGLMEKSGITLTYAEILYGFGYWEFVRQRVDYIVIEVGMGGLLDATNVINRADKVAVITDIGMDHVHVLGETIGEIAAQKAGIIRLHNAVFCHSQGPEVMEQIKTASIQKQADLHVVEQDDRTPKDLPLFQQRNFSLALEAAHFALKKAGDQQLSEVKILEASKIHIPARMEIFERKGKTIILDNAHNPQKLHALAESLLAKFGDRQNIAAMVAFVQTKGRNIDDMMAEIKPMAGHLIITEIPDNKHHTPRPVEEIVAAYDGDNAEVIKDSSMALEALFARPEPILLVTGSMYLMEYIRPTVRKGTVT
jgi:dihydrofolate synthase/folylpolyglutamate synthase